MTQEQSIPPTSTSRLSRIVEGVRGIADPMIGRARKTASNFLERGNDYPKNEYFRITNQQGEKQFLTLTETDQALKKTRKRIIGEGIILPAREPKQNENDARGVIVVDGDRDRHHVSTDKPDPQTNWHPELQI